MPSDGHFNSNALSLNLSLIQCAVVFGTTPKQSRRKMRETVSFLLSSCLINLPAFTSRPLAKNLQTHTLSPPQQTPHPADYKLVGTGYLPTQSLTLLCFGNWYLSAVVTAFPRAWRDAGVIPWPKMLSWRWHKKHQMCLFILYFQCYKEQTCLDWDVGCTEEQNQVRLSWLEPCYFTCIEVLLFNQNLGHIPTLGAFSHSQIILFLPQTHNIQEMYHWNRRMTNRGM